MDSEVFGNGVTLGTVQKASHRQFSFLNRLNLISQDAKLKLFVV